MTPDRLRTLSAIYHGGLTADVVPFWLRHGWDREYGGVISNLDRDGTITDTDKNIWQQGRFAWTLGTLYNTLGANDEWLAAATSALDFIEQHGYDSDGRLFFHMTREGAAIRKRRYAFGESFAAIGYGACAQATGRDDYATRAVAAYERFVYHMTTPGQIPPKSTDARPMKSMGTPMIAIATAQVLRETIGFAAADSHIDRYIDEIQRDFVKHDQRVVMENVAPDGSIIDHLDGRILNPGHAIEGAWFILREAKHRGDSTLTELGCKMLDYMWDRGWDTECGGILYFRDLKDLPVQEYWQDMKFWWPQNETIIATLLAWQLTGDARYAEMHRQIHDWTYRYFPDPEYGEWYGYLHRDGRPSHRMKGTMWKTLFHLPRMQLTAWQICQELLTAAPAGD